MNSLKKIAKKILKSKKVNYQIFPEKHQYAHDYCFMIHDLLAQVVVEAEKAGLLELVIKKNEEEKEFFDELIQNNYSGNDLLNFLEKNDKSSEVYLFLYKKVCIALLSDMAHFIYEALKCSEKGKLIVTYSLLRKPLTENLFYLEYLLYNPAEFIFHFWKGDIEHFALGRYEKLDKKELLKNIEKAHNVFFFEDPEFIHEIRYKKDSEHSFQTYFQHATHLVTQSKAYKTDNTNFNFIFSTTSDLLVQWDGLYTYLPILLFHAYEVVEALSLFIGKRAGALLDITDHRVKIGYLLWRNSSLWEEGTSRDVRTELIDLFNLEKINCERCKAPIESTTKNYFTFYESGFLRCSRCLKKNDFVKSFLKFANMEKKQCNSKSNYIKT
jgi:hypothetical protein